MTFSEAVAAANKRISQESASPEAVTLELLLCGANATDAEDAVEFVVDSLGWPDESAQGWDT